MLSNSVSNLATRARVVNKNVRLAIQRFTSPLYTNSMYIMGGTAATSILSFAFWMLAARNGSPEIVGVASTSISSATLLMSLCDLGLGTALIYYSSMRQRHTTGLINSITSTGWILSGLAALVYVIGIPYFAPGLTIVRENIPIAIVFILFTVASYGITLQDALLLSSNKAKYVFWRNIACNLPSLLLIVPAIYLFRDFRALLIAYCLPNIIVAVSMGLFIIPKSNPGYVLFKPIKLIDISEFIGYGIKNYISNIIWSIPALVLPIIAINISSASEAGKFFFAWTIFNFVLIIPRSITASMFVEGSRDRLMLHKIIRKSTTMIVAVALPAVALLWVLGSYLLLLFGKEYTDTSFLRILLLSVIPFSVNSVCFIALRIKGSMLYTSGFCAMLSIVVLGFIAYLSQSMGVVGLASGWLIGQSLVALFAFVWYACSMIMIYRSNKG